MLDTHDEKKERELPQSELTRSILGCCFEVINFRRRKLEYQRLHQSMGIDSEASPVEEPLPF